MRQHHYRNRAEAIRDLIRARFLLYPVVRSPPHWRVVAFRPGIDQGDWDIGGQPPAGHAD